MIAGGGTGGHVYPAIAIADELKERWPEADILFVGAKGRMEMEKVPKSGYAIEGLWISGLQRRITLSNLLFPIKLLWSYLRSWSLIRRFRPHLAIGVGGYASGPLVHVATLKGIPSMIQEQNSYAGITNRMLGKRVDRICVAFEGMDRWFPSEKLVLTGNPVRKDLMELEGKEKEGRSHFQLSAEKPTLLVLGGSLGARAINESVLEHLDRFLQEGLEILWQTGKRYQEEVQEKLGQDHPTVHAHPFIERMDLAYASADIVIARAGAITVSEIAAAGKTAVFVPSPNVAEDHQTKNAQALVDKGAALLVPEDRAQKELGEKVLGLLHDPDECDRMAANMKAMGFKDSAGRIAEEGLSLLRSEEG